MTAQIKIVAFFFGVFLSSSLFSYSQSVLKTYIGKTHTYSFSVDTTVWYKAPQTKLNNKASQDSKLSGKSLSYDYLFTTDNITETTIPFFIVQPIPTKSNFYSSFKEKFSNQESNLLINNNLDLFEIYLSSISQDIVLFDDSLKTISYVISVKTTEGNDLVSFTCVCFSNNVLVQFVFTSIKTEFSENYIKFKKILDSFNWTKSDSKTLFLKGFGTIVIPPVLEVQSGSYKEMNKKLSRIYGYEYDSDELIIQQEGLNTNSPNAKDTYVRLMFDVIKNSPGTYGSYKVKPQYSIPDLKDLNDILREQVYKNLQSGTVLTMWNGVSITSFNSINCIVVTYERQIGENLPVTVHQYLIENSDKMYAITTSYRTSESAKWKPVIDKVLSSLKIQ